MSAKEAESDGERAKKKKEEIQIFGMAKTEAKDLPDSVIEQDQLDEDIQA